MFKKIASLTGCIFFLFSISIAQSQGIPVSFKYHTGEILNYKLTGEGSGTLKLVSKDPMLNAYGFNSTFKINVNIEGFITASTLSVSPDENGTFNLSLDNLKVTGKLFDQEYQFIIKDRKLQMFTNGQLYSEESLDSVGQKGILKKPVTLSFSNRGKLLDVVSDDMDTWNKSTTMKNLDNWKKKSFSLLPDKPLILGDHWESTTKIDPPTGFILSKPLQVIQSYNVEGFKDMGGENCLVIKTQTSNDFSGLTFTTDTMSLPSVGGKGKMESKFKTGKHTSNGEFIIGVDSGKARKISGTQNLDMDLNMRIPLAEKSAMIFSLTLNGKFTGKIELQ